MKLRQTIATVLVVLIAGFVVFAQENQFSINESPLPAPTGMVNDYANIIDDATQAQIEQKLRDFKAKTNPNIEIAVVTVQTVGERPISDYALAVARGWKIGDKGATNSSALLLIAINDRKYFTQVSGGLQDELTDAIVGQLQRQNLVPAFRAGNYSKGISDTIDAYIRTIEARGDGQINSTNPTPAPARGSGKMPSGCYVLICLIAVFVLLIIIFSRGGKGGGGGSGSGRDRWRSGGFGGVGPVVIWGGGGDSSSSGWGSSSSGGDSWGGFGGGGGGFDGGGAGGDW